MVKIHLYNAKDKQTGNRICKINEPTKNDGHDIKIEQGKKNTDK